MALLSLDGVAPILPAGGDCFIAPGAQVIGRVALAAGTSVWFNAVLRGDNEAIEIGEGSNIQDGCVVHTDPGAPVTVGAGVTVGHRAILHGCAVDDGALIGMGAVVLNRARIGPRCLVGANALVTEGKVFEEGWLIVGQPARAVRPLTDAEIAALALSARKYRWNARRYRAGLTSGAAPGVDMAAE